MIPLDEWEIRFAGDDDLNWCSETDPGLSAKDLQFKIDRKEVILATSGGLIIGCLRLEYLWSRVPYISVIYVWEDHQRRGVGRALVAFAENWLRKKGYAFLLSSSQVDELEPQAWHRAMGFRECGFIAGINQGDIGEIFFRRDLA